MIHCLFVCLFFIFFLLLFICLFSCRLWTKFWAALRRLAKTKSLLALTQRVCCAADSFPRLFWTKWKSFSASAWHFRTTRPRARHSPACTVWWAAPNRRTVSRPPSPKPVSHTKNVWLVWPILSIFCQTTLVLKYVKQNKNKKNGKKANFFLFFLHQPKNKKIHILLFTRVFIFIWIEKSIYFLFKFRIILFLFSF